MAEKVNENDIKTAEKIFEALTALKDEGTLSDVIVSVKGKEFPCHRAQLAAVSGFFKKCLTTDMKEAREGKIELKDITEKTFSTLLACIYGGKYVLRKDNFFDIWTAADMLDINFITAQCLDFLVENVSNINYVGYLCKARLLSEQGKQTRFAIYWRELFIVFYSSQDKFVGTG
ncbi:kelch-like family member 35 [Elysia marginata]|uniref:Kelch-like family member 35 n=1 Tax=Elysia marginata TaxID=1093978 RepID=A0AAV4HMP0_9GAST|nr:kelch-like family member 35 [Elysia marginata]